MANVFRTHPKLSWIVVSVVAVVGIIAALELTNTTYWFHDKPAPYTASEYTKGESTTNNGGENENSGSTGSSESNKESGSTSATLVEPSGNFVSSHHATLTSNLSSTCNSTPGATCKITFTKDGVNKSLSVKTVDSGGAAYWSWQPGDIGLSPGNWSVKATVQLGDKSESAMDALSLEIR